MENRLSPSGAESGTVSAVLSLLPRRCHDEILHLCASRRNFYDELSEIRLRAAGRSALVLSGRNVPLVSKIGRAEISDIVTRLCHGSLYAYRDTIGSGYIPMEGGVRVGLCGQARYEGGRLVGISDMTSLVFRIPHTRCESADILFEEWERGVVSGMLIYSPPGIGKTTALRALAARIGSGGHPRRVAVVDERCEFAAVDYSDCTVDLLRGYRRATGIEIAVRTLSPEVLIVDEIGGEGEARSMLGVLKTGVPLIATAHASSYAELTRRKSLSLFLECGVFDVFVGLSRREGGFHTEVMRLP